jgi:pyruvate kinase
MQSLSSDANAPLKNNRTNASRLREVGAKVSPRKTKIVCTLGPASDSLEMIERLMMAGMNCARLNFSHGTPEEHLEVMNRVRRVSSTHGRSVAIMQDLPGAKIRVGDLKGGAITLRRGEIVTVTSSREPADENEIPIRQKNLIEFVPIGASVYLSDGLIRLKVISKDLGTLKCRCLNGGRLLSGKGVNIPELAHGFKGFTSQDQKLLEFGLKHDVDLVAISFVESAENIRHVRHIIEKIKPDGSNPWLVSKIERKEAVRNMREIVAVSDAVMVARGDLGVENPVEDVPIIQKTLISECNRKAVPVITATQMLESMVTNPRPTRAEASDASNAVLDGTDALMLSEETAVGAYPVECVRTLDRVARSSENWIFSNSGRNYGRAFNLANDALPESAVSLSREVGADLLICPTMSGGLARRISRERPSVPLVALTYSSELGRKLSIVWGVTSLDFMENPEIIWGAGRSSSIELLRKTIGSKLIFSRFARAGEKVVLARDTFEETRQTGDLLLTMEVQARA